MNTVYSHLVRAGLLCGALAASSAYAVTPSQVTAANRLYISGATATDNALATLFLRTGNTDAPPVCKSGTIDVYTDTAAPVTGSKQKAILCTLNQAVGGIAANTNVAFLKESNGGSNEGTQVIARGVARTFLNIANDAAPNCTTTTTQAAGSIASYPSHQAFTLHSVCSGLDTAAKPDVGIADVNPALFNIGLTPISTAEVNRLQSDSLYQPSFGVAVSLNLYRALQSLQSKTVTSDTAADMPSLTSAQVRGLITGNIFSWDQITGPTGTPLASKPVFVCRRGDDSGTQASFASYFLNERCVNGGPNFVTATNTASQQSGSTWNFATFGTDPVFAGAGSGDVRNCLDGHNDHDDFAVGILGTESRYDALGSAGGSANAAAGTQEFRYVKLDGRTPNLESVANGVYDFVEENVMNRLNTAFNGQNPPSGNKAALANYVRDSFGNLDVISTLVVSQSHGLTGGLAPALGAGVTPNAIPVSAAQVVANPVSPYTKSLNGPVFDCGPATTIAPTLAPVTTTNFNGAAQ
jgi:ABC-type phosphate transport system substrate-binding protein